MTANAAEFSVHGLGTGFAMRRGMKTMARVIAVASVAMLVWACGGKVNETMYHPGEGYDGGVTGDDVSGDDSGIYIDGGRQCTPLPGCTSTTSCPAADGCNECSCVDGAWACGDLGCPVDASTAMCPASPPDVGTFCQDNGLSCTFGTSCGPEFVCRNNVWGMVIRTCPPPVCPPSPPSGGCNGQAGISCSWGSGCNMETCDCVATPGGALWECSGTACVDAGHTGTGDAGH